MPTVNEITATIAMVSVIVIESVIVTVIVTVIVIISLLSEDPVEEDAMVIVTTDVSAIERNLKCISARRIFPPLISKAPGEKTKQNKKKVNLNTKTNNNKKKIEIKLLRSKTTTKRKKTITSQVNF